MEAPASHFRGGLVRGTVLPLRCPQTMSISFWSVGGAAPLTASCCRRLTRPGEPFELTLDMVRGNARASWTRRRQGHSHSARFDVPSKDVRQLYDFLLSCQISEFVMYNDVRADNRIGCNLKLSIPIDEGNQEEAVVQLADSGTTFVTGALLSLSQQQLMDYPGLCAQRIMRTDHVLSFILASHYSVTVDTLSDKWIPTWELLCAALKNWSDHLLARSTVSFEVLFENALQHKGFELRLDDARSLDVLEPPVRWLPEGQRVVLHGPQGLHQMKLVIDAHVRVADVLHRLKG